MLYKITLKQNTGFIGKIIANTLLGAFLTAYSTLKDITEKDIICLYRNGRIAGDR